MSYIEREKAIEFVLDNVPHINGETTFKCVVRALKEAPTADVVEVVRSKDCRHLEKVGDCMACAIHETYYIEDDDFCSRGERSENGTRTDN